MTEVGKTDSLVATAKDIILIIPALHLFCCFVYLFFYYYSFGNGLIYLASPKEVFSVSLSKVAPLYLFGGLGIAIGSWSYETDEEIKERYSDGGARFATFTKRGTHWLVIIAASTSGIIGLWASIIGPYIFWYMFLLPLGIATSWAVGYFAGTRGLPRSVTYGLNAFLIAIICIAIFGLSDGQNAARSPNSIVERGSVRCNEKLILKDVSDRFLAIDSEENIVIIDQDCGVVFDVIAGGGNAPESPHNAYKVIHDYYVK